MLTSINGSLYSITDMGQNLQNVMRGWGSSVPTFSSNMDPSQVQRAIHGGFLQPYQALQQQPQQQPTQQPLSTQSIQPQLNRLTQQANNALYGGLLGYNQNLPMMSGGQNPQTFAAPQGNFRDAFAGMQGLLGGR